MDDQLGGMDGSIDHQEWIDISSLIASRELSPFGIQQKSPRVTIELVPAGAPFPKRFQVQGSDVTMMVAFGPNSAWEAVHSDRLRRSSFRNRSHFMPGDVFQRGVIGEGLPEFLMMIVDQAFIQATMDDLFDGDCIEERPVIRDATPTLLTLGRAMRNKLLGGGRSSALQLESFATLCLAEFFDTAPTASTPPFAGKLRKLDDFIRDRLHQDLSLADLAAVAELSPSHFLRSFKEATGQTPHRYLMDCRLQQARDRLTTTDLALADIAYACGFASQSHMTDVFKANLDITPGRYRRARRS